VLRGAGIWGNLPFGECRLLWKRQINSLTFKHENNNGYTYPIFSKLLHTQQPDMHASQNFLLKSPRETRQASTDCGINKPRKSEVKVTSEGATLEQCNALYLPCLVGMDPVRESQGPHRSSCSI
jgi:hypothetical protein